MIEFISFILLATGVIAVYLFLKYNPWEDFGMSVEQKEQLKVDAANKVEEAYNLGLGDAGSQPTFTQADIDAAVQVAVVAKDVEKAEALASLKASVGALVASEDQDLLAKLAAL